MRIGEFLRRHTLLVGLAAVLTPLAILMVVQFIWLLRLERAQAIAHEAALESFLGSVSTKIEYVYRETAERSLNLPASLFTQHHLAKAAYYWKQRPAKGARRLFLVDFTHEDFGHFLAFDPEKAELYAPVASDESLAMILAANPIHMLNMRQHGMESASLTVDERNPDQRIVLNPILDDAGRVVGLAGMILDETYFRDTLLPAVIGKAIGTYFPSAPRGEVSVMVKDAKGEPVVCVGDSEGRPVVARTRLGFVFADWELSLYSPRATPQQWARTTFLFNASLSGLLAAALVGGVVLALRAADRAVRLSAMKSDFVSNVSHELRTPVASIRVFGELLRTGPCANAGEDPRIRRVHRSREPQAFPASSTTSWISPGSNGRPAKEYPLRSNATCSKSSSTSSGPSRSASVPPGCHASTSTDRASGSRRSKRRPRRDRPGVSTTCSDKRGEGNSGGFQVDLGDASRARPIGSFWRCKTSGIGIAPRNNAKCSERLPPRRHRPGPRRRTGPAGLGLSLVSHIGQGATAA
jgi:hypothetical protein